MTLVVPQVGQVQELTRILTPTLTLKLYSNNLTPTVTTVLSDITEVTGGGYTSKSLTFANWTITTGTPSVGLYNSFQDFNFTGATGGPGTIYGYYVIDGTTLLYVERFPTVPFTPINGSLIRIKPRLTQANAA